MSRPSIVGHGQRTYSDSLDLRTVLAQDRELDGVGQGKRLLRELTQEVGPSSRACLVACEETVLALCKPLVATSNGSVLVHSDEGVQTVNRENPSTIKLLHKQKRMSIYTLQLCMPRGAGTYRSELTLEALGESVLPSLDLALEFSRRDSKGLRSDVYSLDAKLVGKEDQRSGKV